MYKLNIKKTRYHENPEKHKNNKKEVLGMSKNKYSCDKVEQKVKQCP